MANGRTTYGGNSTGINSAVTTAELQYVVNQIYGQMAKTNLQQATNIENLYSLGDSMKDAKKHRDSIEAKYEKEWRTRERMDNDFSNMIKKNAEERNRIEAKFDAGVAEHQDIYKAIGTKANKDHKHKGGNEDDCDCEWYDIICQGQCKIDEGFEGLGKLALIGGAVIVGIWLLKMRLGK